MSHISHPGLAYRELQGSPTYLAAVVVWPKHHVSRATLAVLELMEQIFPTPERPPERILD